MLFFLFPRQSRSAFLSLFASDFLFLFQSRYFFLHIISPIVVSCHYNSLASSSASRVFSLPGSQPLPSFFFVFSLLAALPAIQLLRIVSCSPASSQQGLRPRSQLHLLPSLHSPSLRFFCLPLLVRCSLRLLPLPVCLVLLFSSTLFSSLTKMKNKDLFPFLPLLPFLLHLFFSILPSLVLFVCFLASLPKTRKKARDQMKRKGGETGPPETMLDGQCMYSLALSVSFPFPASHCQDHSISDS